MDPQFDIYLQREEQDELIMVTMRDEHGALAGYFIGFIAPGLHYQTCLTCTMDIFYVKAEYRDKMAGVKLFRYVERELRSRGVNRWFVGSKCHKDAGILFRRLKFEKVEEYYSKYLG